MAAAGVYAFDELHAVVPTDPPRVLQATGLRAEVRRYACPDRQVIVLTSHGLLVADFTSLAALARCVALADVEVA
jgi:hypothetical protein